MSHKMRCQLQWYLKIQWMRHTEPCHFSLLIPLPLYNDGSVGHVLYHLKSSSAWELVIFDILCHVSRSQCRPNSENYAKRPFVFALVEVRLLGSSMLHDCFPCRLSMKYQTQNIKGFFSMFFLWLIFVFSFVVFFFL